MIDLQSIIDEVLVKANQESKRVPKASPSNIGKCLRQLILMENNYPHRNYTPQQLRVFKAGYLFEKFVEQALEESGKLYDKQVHIKYRGIDGTLDHLIRDDVAKEIVIADCKSVNSGKFDYLDRGEVDSGYALQQTDYYEGLQEAINEGSYKLPEGYTLSKTVWLFYVEKECILTKQIAVDPNKWIGKLHDKIDKLNDARMKFQEVGLLPDELDPMTTWECFTVQKTKHKVPRPIGVKVWCNYIENCPNVCAKKQEIESQIKEAINE